MTIVTRFAHEAARADTAQPQDDLERLAAEVADDPVALAAYEDAVRLEAFVRRLVEVRKERNLSQADVADRLGTTQSVISALEKHRTNPHLSVLQRYARACDRAVVLTLLDEAGRSPQWLPLEAADSGPQPSPGMGEDSPETHDDLLELAEDVSSQSRSRESNWIMPDRLETARRAGGHTNVLNVPSLLERTC